MKLRLVSRLLVPALVVIVGSVIFVHNQLAQRAQSHPTAPVSKTQGIDLGGEQAPSFALVDQKGERVSLEAQRGHPVVIAFLYTHCPDACPLTAEKLHTTVTNLGARAANVRWLAVSIDPLGDTPASATQFVAAHHLTGHLQYLLGSQDQLQPVWVAYHIGVVPGQNGQASVQTVTHTMGLYVIDGQGLERVYFDQSFDPEDLAANLSALLH